MANTEISERAILFEYGFLTSRTSRILSKVIKTGNLKLDSRERDAIEHARDFVDKILKEGAFVSGELEEGMAPDFDRLTTFNRALNTLETLQQLPNTSKEIRDYFKSIKDSLDNLLRSSLKDVQSLASASAFFSTIADMLLEELSGAAEPDLIFR